MRIKNVCVNVASFIDSMFDVNQIDPDLLNAHWGGELHMDLCFMP